MNYLTDLEPNSPIDITSSNITGKCSYKCSYSFHYNNSSCIVTNRGHYLSLSYDKSSVQPVTYNATNYDVDEVRIYIPSLHSYSGSKIDGELVIIHSSKIGATPLLVCIPIKENSILNSSSTLFESIIDTVANNAPINGDSTTVNVDTYNLTELVPNKPFYSYSATEPYQPFSTTVDYIVYSPLNASLDIMHETLEKLQSIIEDHPYDIKSGPKLFFNEVGPSRIGNGNEIYIDCQPVGNSEETTDIVKNEINPLSFQDWMKNPMIKMFLGTLLFIIILFVIKYLLDLFQEKRSSNLGANSITG